MIRVLFCILALAIFAASDVSAQEIPVQAQPAQTAVVDKPTKQNAVSAFFHNLWNKITKKQDDDPDPTATLVAPFADSSVPAAKPEDRTIMRLSTTSGPLDQPHRSSADLGEWLTQAMSEAMSFNADDYQGNMKMLIKGMTSEALVQYNDWVTTSGIFSTLQANNMQLNGSVEEKPFLVNEGPVGGRYRWLFEVPVLISFVPRGAVALDKQTEIADRKLIMTIQLGRVAVSELPDHVMIETWSVRENTRKN